MRILFCLELFLGLIILSPLALCFHLLPLSLPFQSLHPVFLNHPQLILRQLILLFDFTVLIFHFLLRGHRIYHLEERFARLLLSTRLGSGKVGVVIEGIAGRSHLEKVWLLLLTCRSSCREWISEII